MQTSSPINSFCVCNERAREWSFAVVNGVQRVSCNTYTQRAFFTLLAVASAKMNTKSVQLDVREQSRKSKKNGTINAKRKHWICVYKRINILLTNSKRSSDRLENTYTHTICNKRTTRKKILTAKINIKVSFCCSFDVENPYKQNRRFRGESVSDKNRNKIKIEP